MTPCTIIIRDPNDEDHDLIIEGIPMNREVSRVLEILADSGYLEWEFYSMRTKTIEF